MSLDVQPGLLAVPHAARLSIVAAARAFDAQGFDTVGDPEEVLLAHHAIESGRRSFLAGEERHGRFLSVWALDGVAPMDPLLPELSSRDARAAAMAALGHGLKVIGFALGVSIATASRRLAYARQALGVPTQAALVAIIHARARARFEPRFTTS